MANALPPTPFKFPVVDPNGLVSQAWAGYFRELFLRVGGTSSSSINALQTIINAQAVTLAALTVSNNDLGQGTQL